MIRIGRRETVLALAAAGLVMVLWASGLLRALERPVGDLVLRLPRPTAAAEAPVSAVLIDDAAVAALGPLPWPRSRLARLVREVRARGARAVVVDLILSDAHPEEEDRQLEEALAGAPRVLAAVLDPDRQWLLPRERFGGLRVAAHAHAETAPDGVVRAIAATKQNGELSLPALAVAAARLAGHGRIYAAGEVLRCDFRIPPQQIPQVGAAALLEGAVAPDAFSERVVFIGISASGSTDQFILPVTGTRAPVPGVLAHASITASLLAGGTLRPLAGGWLALATVTLALGVQLLRTAAGRFRVVWFLALGAAVLLLAPVSLWSLRLLVPAVTLVATLVLSALLREAVESREVLRESDLLLRSLVEEAGADAGRSVGAAGRLRLLRQLQRELDRKRRETQRLVAHELKTPLASLAGFGQMLERYSLEPEELRRVAALIRGESERLGEMVAAFLDLERLRDGEWERTEIDLGQLADERRRVLAAAAGEGQEIRLQVTGSAVVIGAPDLLARLFDNLVGNALKFAPESPTEVVVRGHDDAVVVEVRDRGPGIPPEALPHLFERFYRVPGAAAPGSGLGLATVKEIVSWHGGCVEVTSEPGAGTTFVVTLPAAGAERTER